MIIAVPPRNSAARFLALTLLLVILGDVPCAWSDDLTFERSHGNRGRAPKSLLIDGFESYPSQAFLDKQWRNPHQERSTVHLVPSESGQGCWSMRWDYILDKYSLRAAFVDRDPRPFDGFRFWVKPDGSGRVLDLGIKNHAQKYFQTKGLLVMNRTKPVAVTVPFSRLGPGMKDELVEELWFIVNGKQGSGTLVLDALEFYRDDGDLVIDSFETYTSSLTIYQHWRTSGLLGDVEHVSPSHEAGTFEEGSSSLALHYKLPDVNGVTSEVDVDARGYVGLRFWVLSAKAPATLIVTAKNHAQEIWTSRPLDIAAGVAQVVTLPLTEWHSVDCATSAPRKRGGPIDEYLERLSFQLLGKTGSGVLYIDNVQLTRPPADVRRDPH